MVTISTPGEMSYQSPSAIKKEELVGNPAVLANHHLAQPHNQNFPAGSLTFI